MYLPSTLVRSIAGPAGRAARSSRQYRGITEASMYAVIQTGGKQYRVAEGDRIDVERLGAGSDGDVALRPVMLVDGDDVLATPQQLSAATVNGRVVGDAKGPKIRGFTYKNKSNQRRRWGHRQHYSTIEITAIARG